MTPENEKALLDQWFSTTRFDLPPLWTEVPEDYKSDDDDDSLAD
jgi:hypothetical protein